MSVNLNSDAPLPQFQLEQPRAKARLTQRLRDRWLRARISSSSTLSPDAGSPTVVSSLRIVATFSWINLLVVFVPISWSFHFIGLSDTLTFIFSFFAIIPLANLYSLATEELCKRVGQTMAGLINATLGNVVELIVAIVALTHCELGVVQSSLIGSMLSNLLLVLGMCFIAAGYHYQENGFSVLASQTNSSLLILVVFCFVLTGTYYLSSGSVAGVIDQDTILKISRAMAIVLLLTYLAYLFFQHESHASMFEDNEANTRPSKQYPNQRSSLLRFRREISQDQEASSSTDSQSCQEEDAEEKPQLCLSVVIALLLLDTVLVAITSEWLVSSINGLTSSGKISKEFVGLILLPIVGNAAEHASAVTVALKNKLTLSLAVAAGSSIQIGFFVYPAVVLVAWIMGKPLTMLIDVLEFIVLLFAVLAGNYVVQDGKSNWLEGVILLNIYVIIAVVFWFYPGSALIDMVSCT